MVYLHENIRKYRMMKNLTQEELAEYLSITAQSVSKWERGETYPDITFLPALANLFETSIDLLMGMNAIRAEAARYQIHNQATHLQKSGDLAEAEKIYRDALLVYPNKPGMMLGLACTLALMGKTEEAIEWMEKGLPLSENEKQKATVRATLCFLYLKDGEHEKAIRLASELPHQRESREVILPLVKQEISFEEIDQKIKTLILGET